MKVTNSIKKDLTTKEEYERIVGNLKRMRETNTYAFNHMTECYKVGHKLVNLDVCGIDKQAYDEDRLLRNSTFCIENARLSNYLIVRLAIKEFLPRGTFEELMDYTHFVLYTHRGEVYWGDFGNNENKWTHLTSADICHRILYIIKKKMILNELEKNAKDN